MKEIVFGMMFGLFVGTLPGVREITPWGVPKPTPAPEPIALVTPTPRPGEWMFNRPPTALDKGPYNPGGGPGRAIIYDPIRRTTPYQR